MSTSSLGDLLATCAATGQPEIAIRVVRLFAESVRLASEAALGVYGDVVAALDPELAGLPPDVEYERLFVPWARIARAAPDLARWLTARHMSRAIDAYSVEATERILEQHGFVPERPDVPPGIAFVDLTGFTRVSESAATRRRPGSPSASASWRGRPPRVTAVASSSSSATGFSSACRTPPERSTRRSTCSSRCAPSGCRRATQASTPGR